MQFSFILKQCISYESVELMKEGKRINTLSISSIKKLSPSSQTPKAPNHYHRYYSASSSSLLYPPRLKQKITFISES